jgi:murein DD-endopeptidase MepM/ murein hydrolase activator NlpD
MATSDERYSSRFAAIKNAPPELVSFLGRALGNIFLIKSPWIGAILWLAIARDIRFPIFAIVGLVVADVVAWALGVGHAVNRVGPLRANAIFVSIAVAWLTTATGYSLAIPLAVAVFAAIGASLITAAIVRALRHTVLPPLEWGYCVVAAMLFNLFPAWAQSAVHATIVWPRPQDAIGWIESFFRSLGMLVFLPKPEVGVLVALAIVLWSRAMMLTGAVGWLVGVALGLFLERLGVTYLWLLAAHNYFLAAMLLGSILFLPGWTRAFVAVAAGAGASIFAAYFQYLLPGSSYAFLPVPAGLTVWLGMGALLLGDNNRLFQRDAASQGPPELAWWNSAYLTERFGQREPLLTVPVAGAVQITQGFNGQLSHAGGWRHALDFQRPVPTVGAELGNSIWGSPIYAPASGIVEAVRGGIPDNPLGVSNFAENWGNYIIIRLDTDGWAMLAHLRQGTIAVANGARVETSTYLAQVGNSGRSPSPHLHLQAQASPEPGAPTIPFRLANFLSASGPSSDFLRWNAADVPDTGSIVSAAQSNPKVHATLTSIAPGAAVWQVEAEGKIPRQFRRYGTGSVVRVRIFLDQAGRHLFRSHESGTLVTYIDVDAWRLIEVQDVSCPLLKLLALAVPSIPYAASEGTNWLEPAPLPPSGLGAWFELLVFPYLKHPFPYLACTCTVMPDDGNQLLTIETRPITPSRGMPTKLLCEMDRLRGPVKIEASFEGGQLCYTMLSFAPADLPLSSSSTEGRVRPYRKDGP